MEIEHTERGFEIIEFKDLYGVKCSLQQSSLALYTTPGSSAIWLGGDEDRMHLNEEQVGKLIEYLTNWLKHGTFVL
jgi:hypothetical protein